MSRAAGRPRHHQPPPSLVITVDRLRARVHPLTSVHIHELGDPTAASTPMPSMRYRRPYGRWPTVMLRGPGSVWAPRALAAFDEFAAEENDTAVA